MSDKEMLELAISIASKRLNQIAELAMNCPLCKKLKLEDSLPVCKRCPAYNSDFSCIDYTDMVNELSYRIGIQRIKWREMLKKREKVK